ncbi:MAG: porin family protein [Prevotella sp.]|uniref:porin family protein n=1 Tax=Prevotella sp. TaxID=59823 RepID=UPI002A2843F4|nr:porin family protein [Prevotella sp.]MDD7318959.1 porin family protein [Prevotellaceae bacterium]MDY4019985.1 porin family protein [Prevotella sp.]
MKKIIATIALAALVMMPSYAQNYKRSKYYNRNTQRLDYGRRTRGNYNNRDVYYGFRVGPAFTTVNSDNHLLDGGKTKTGLNVGLAVGVGLTDRAPLYFESGLYYIEKGGKNKKAPFDFTYNLGYVELPFVMKYAYNIDNTFSIQPFFGGYFACGVSGKIKNYNNRKAYSSFDGDYDSAFERLDAGLRMGVGVGIDMFYADLTYDLGLANIGHDDFDECKNSAVMLTFGVNF